MILTIIFIAIFALIVPFIIPNQLHQESELDEVRYYKIDEIEKLENSLFDWTEYVKELLKKEA